MSELEQCLTALEKIGMGMIRKSASGKSDKVMKAMATAEATKTRAGAVLARRILQLEQQQVIRKQYAPILKSMDLDDSQESDTIGKLENLQAEKLEIVRSLNAGNQDPTAIKRLQKIYDQEGDLIRDMIEVD